MSAGILSLGAALAAMAAEPGATDRRLAFHAALLRSEVAVWLAAEPGPEGPAPRIFPLSEGPAVMAFEDEAALAAFAGAQTPYAALNGRMLVASLAAAGLGLVVQGAGGAAEHLPAATVAWLARQSAAARPELLGERPLAWVPPGSDDVARLVPRLERVLGTALPLPAAGPAVLVRASWGGGRYSLVLGLSGVPVPVQAAVAQAVAEALEPDLAAAGGLDVMFAGPAELLALAAHGRVLTPRRPPSAPPPAPPGSDPARPPRLR